MSGRNILSQIAQYTENPIEERHCQKCGRLGYAVKISDHDGPLFDKNGQLVDSRFCAKCDGRLLDE